MLAVSVVLPAVSNVHVSNAHEHVSNSQWRARSKAHTQRVRTWTKDRLTRRSHGRTHPVDDFLWDYYPFSAAKLQRWHPGPGITLAGTAHAVLEVPGFIERDGCTVFDADALDPERRAYLAKEVTWVLRLLRNVTDKPARFGCFGLHEWAMVLGQSADDVRHRGWPLRISPEQVRATINEVGLRCTHFDAFRFFTSEAIPLNPIQQMNRSTQPDLDQGGCLHANMDLYKWTMRLQPLVPMDFVADCFELARDVRHLDMQGAPYDLAELGVEPIPLETAAGRTEFAVRQREQAERAADLRGQLIAFIEPWENRL